MSTMILTIPDEYWLTSNQRLHWAAKAKRTKFIRTLAHIGAGEAFEGRTWMQVHVGVFVGYPTRSKADPSNAAPAVKAALDGLTDAGVWPDDDSEHVVTVTYAREASKSGKGTHTLRLVLTDQALPF